MFSLYEYKTSLTISHFSLQLLCDLNVLCMLGYATSIAKMLIKLLQSRLYSINRYITFCIVGRHDLRIKCLLQ